MALSTDLFALVDLSESKDTVSQESRSRNSSTLRLSPKETSPGATNPQTRHTVKTLFFSHGLFFAMHLLLVIVHLILLIIDLCGADYKVQVPVGKPTTILSIAISLVSQTFAIVYLTLLLYVTQDLARRTLYPQSTAATVVLDSRQTAWMGLGSAINTLRTQISMHGPFSTITAITVYLFLTAGLKITTPALLGLTALSLNESMSVNSTRSDPFLLVPIWNKYRSAAAPGLKVQQDMDNLRTIAPTIALLLSESDARITDFELGLQDNMIYDIVDVNLGIGSAEVNAHFMNVTCGRRKTLDQVAQNVRLQPDVAWSMTAESQQSISIPLISPNVLSIGASVAAQPHNSCIYPFASLNIVDSAGANASQVTLDPPMNPLIASTFQVDSSVSGFLNPSIVSASNLTPIYNFNVSSVSLFICSLSISNGTTTVDARTRLPLAVQQRKNTSTWRDYDPATQGSSPLYDLWAESILGFAGTTANSTISDPCQGQTDVPQFIQGFNVTPSALISWPECGYMTQTERFILDQLSVQPAVNMSWLLDVPIPQD
ncbi:hypothetical protein C8J56DRAFT_135839 [Mycena floridula]|nr:hypothetical protein C8J56DRAFT_135839 [Mycena floridula]